MKVIALIHRELADAEATGYKRIVHIRVTTAALPGAPVSVPVTPERARVIGCLVTLYSPRSGMTVDADPHWYESALELLIHPRDYTDLLTDANAASTVDLATGLRSVFGVPIAREARP